MIVFEGIAVGVGVLLAVSHLIDRIPVQRGVLLGIAAGLGFGISDVAIKALSGDLESGPAGLLSPWSVVIVTAAVFSFYASARSLQIGDGVAVIAVTSVAANLSTILAGLAVFGDRLGNDALVDRRARRGVRPDPRRGGADPGARSRRRGARGVSRGARERYPESRLSRTSLAERGPQPATGFG